VCGEDASSVVSDASALIPVSFNNASAPLALTLQPGASGKPGRVNHVVSDRPSPTAPHSRQVA
jgi:hypothetical protein